MLTHGCVPLPRAVSDEGTGLPMDNIIRSVGQTLVETLQLRNSLVTANPGYQYDRAVKSISMEANCRSLA